jgi:hypothetical protein
MGSMAEKVEKDGMLKGAKENSKVIALRLMRMEMDLNSIAYATGLSMEELLELRSQNKLG